MTWKENATPEVEAFKGPSAYVELFKEIVASALFIIIGSNGSTATSNGWSWAIAFVVVRIVFSGSHVNSWLTIYNMFIGKANLFKGLLFLGAQFFGAFIAASLAGPLDLKQDVVASFAIGEWAAGLKEFIALSLFLWCFLHGADKDTDVSPMPIAIFNILTVAVTFFFSSTTVFSLSRCFMSAAAIKACWPYLIWGFAAVVVTHVKRALCGFEDRWFWEN